MFKSIVSNINYILILETQKEEKHMKEGEGRGTHEERATHLETQKEEEHMKEET